MEGLDLSSLSVGIVEAAALPSQPVNVQPGAPGQSTKVPLPEIISQTTPTLEIEPLDLSNSPEEVNAALENLNTLIELGEVEDDDDEPGENGVTKSKTSDASVYPALAAFLKEKGIITSEDKIEDEESFVSAISKTIEESKYSNLSESQKLYLKSIEAGIPDEQAKSIVTNMESITKVTAQTLIDNAELAENIITVDLKAQGWDDARIAKQIERLRKTEEVVGEALTSKDNIINRANSDIEAQRVAKIAEKAENEKKETNQLIKLKDAVFTYDKALGAVKVDDRLKNQVYETMTKPVAYLENGQPINALTKDRNEDPVDFEKRMYYAYVLTNGFKDLSRLQRRAETSAAKKLKDVVSGLNLDMTGMGTSVHPNDDGVVVPEIVSV